MKKTNLMNITIFNTILLLTGCSTSQDNINNKSIQNVSIYKIMGITEATKEASHLHERKLETTTLKEGPTSDITYISYKQESSFMDDLLAKKLQTLDNIELKAKSFLGVPYVWGATGPNKFDCSGFTQWVYRDSGINIPRVSREQARIGEFVLYDNLQRGDMVFFDTKKKRTGRVSHVGIYLGMGNFIHASSSGKSVVIYNFNKKNFYKKRFLWGRRVLKENPYYALN